MSSAHGPCRRPGDRGTRSDATRPRPPVSPTRPRNTDPRQKPFFEGACAAEWGEESTSRREEARGFGGRQLASRGYEIGRETSRITRLEDPPLEQHDRGAVPLAPDRPASGLEEPVHRRIDDRVVVAVREAEFPGVVVSEGLPFYARRAEREAHHDDGRQEIVVVVDALTERPALDPEEEGSTAIRPGEPQRLEGPVPLGFAPLRALHEDLFRDVRRPKAPMRLSKQFVRREECREVPGHRGRDAADLPSDRVVHLLAPFHEQGRYMGRYQKQSVLPRKWRGVGP